MASVSIDAIVELISSTFDTLETLILPSWTPENTSDIIFALGEMIDRFKVWLSNTTVAREKCASYENCLRNNLELKHTFAEVLVDIKDDLSEAQELAQHGPRHKTSSDVDVSEVPDHSDLPSMLSPILVDVNSAITCLMRLSKPLLDNHRRHRRTDRYCTEGDTHHAQGLQRLLPLAELTSLEQLSRSTCARRSELLAMHSRRESSGQALKPLDDDAFLRVVFLELASVTGEGTLHDPHARSGIEAAEEVEEELNATRDTGKAESPGTRLWKDEKAQQVDSVLSTPSYISDPYSTRSSNAQPTKDQGPQAQIRGTGKAESPGPRLWKDEKAEQADSIVPTSSYISDPNSTRSSNARPTRDQGPQARISDTQEPRKARVIDSSSSDDTVVTMVITACLRCRARKVRCDPGLPKCGPCERTNNSCDYYDPRNGREFNRNYIIHLQHKVAELESQLDHAADLDSLESEGAEAKSPELPAPASSVATDTNQFPRSKTCVICNQCISYSSKSELRQHYLGDLQPYICLHADCDRRNIRYPTLEGWTAHIRSSHGQVFRCFYGCTQTITTRTAFEDHLRTEHHAQFTDAELPTLVDLCQKHQLNNTAAKCPLCAEAVSSPERFYHHLANHMEDVALLSLMPNLPCKFSTDVDVVPTPSETAILDAVQRTTTPDHENTSSNANDDDLQTLFSPEPGFQALVLSASNPNPTPTYTVEFADFPSAFKAAYKLNHHPISMSDSTSISSNPDSRLSINLIDNTLNVRITRVSTFKIR